MAAIIAAWSWWLCGFSLVVSLFPSAAMAADVDSANASVMAMAFWIRDGCFMWCSPWPPAIQSVAPCVAAPLRAQRKPRLRVVLAAFIALSMAMRISTA